MIIHSFKCCLVLSQVFSSYFPLDRVADSAQTGFHGLFRPQIFRGERPHEGPNLGYVPRGRLCPLPCHMVVEAHTRRRTLEGERALLLHSWWDRGLGVALTVVHNCGHSEGYIMIV